MKSNRFGISLIGQKFILKQHLCRSLILIFGLVLVFFSKTYAQLVPAERLYEWNLAGFRQPLPNFSITHNILDFGGDNTGSNESNTALSVAINALNGKAGIVYFPEGEYLFTAPLFLPDSIILRGESSERTGFRFDFGGVTTSNLISINGESTDTVSRMKKSFTKGMDYVIVDSAIYFKENDCIKLFQTDSAYVPSDWAWNSSGQIVRIKKISSDTLFLESKLRRNYFMQDSSRIRKVKLKSFVGIECVHLINRTKSIVQTSMVDFEYTSHCWISGVESDSCYFAHIAIGNSTNILVEQSFFHNAYSYGGGGEGYGISLEYTSGECLIQNNIFSTLRHAILLQSGANGNVIAYNYVRDPKYFGDLVLHGNYPYANLFEGNVVPCISVDNSHGINGPHNFFYRNRAYGLGILCNATPPSDSQSFIANEITYPISGVMSINGNAQLVSWNNKDNDLVTVPPQGLLPASYLFSASPYFFSGEDPWPLIGYPTPYNVSPIPAERNYMDGFYTACGLPRVTSYSKETETAIGFYPNPANKELNLINLPTKITGLKLYNANGVFIKEYKNNENSINLEKLPSGFYIISIESPDTRFWGRFIHEE